MSPGADAHSRLVGAAKLVLPLLGLALLSALFLLPGIGGRPTTDRIPQAQDVAVERRLTAPIHAGVTKAGDAVELAADVARPDPGDPRRMEARGIRAHLVSPGGSDLTLTAPRGRVDTGAGTAALSGGVRVEGVGEGAGPIVAEALGLAFDLRTGIARSDGLVRAEAAMGEIEAGALTVQGTRLEFREGVRLVLAPPG